MSEKKKLKIGITIGDLNGIGLEVIMKTLMDNRILDFCTPIIYGSAKAVSYHRKALDFNDFNYHIAHDLGKVNTKTANVLNCWNEEVNITYGEITEEAGKYALTSLDLAAADVNDGKIDAIVTAPVNKHNIHNIYPDFYGQTEYLAMKAGVGSSLMFLLSDNLRVGLVTNHLPVKDVVSNISQSQIINKLELIQMTLKQDFLIDKPRIAVLGLNPHAGDNGSIGMEEMDIVKPAIKEAKDRGILCFGPYAADGFFGSHNYNNFDAVLAMYHDQGLIPFKALTFGSGVNYTAGLPFIRTSPDHGTAYEIAGKGEASAESFRSALFLALDLVRNRRDFHDMRKNPMAKTEFSREIG